MKKTAQAAIDKIKKSQRLQKEEDERLEKLLCFEKELWNAGFCFVAGVDEAGIGPLAGPVVAGAVILPKGCKISGLDDSKKILNITRREKLETAIKENALAWMVGSAEPEEIDSLNIYRAGLLAMQRAVEGLVIKPDYLLVDARKIPDTIIAQRGIIHGDALSMSIAAASILAKTARDRHMLKMDALYPGYGLARHKGYPTREHLAALSELGPTPIHRRSFTPVREKAKQLELFDTYRANK